MKYKICYLLILVFIFNSSAFANAIIKRSSNAKNTAIQNSSILYSSYYNKLDDDSVRAALNEIQSKIKLNPNDYILYVSLVDIYMKSMEYEKAYNELVFLSNLSRQNKLDSAVKNYISNVYQNTQKSARYSKSKGLLCLNLSMMALIIGDNNQAEVYINKATNYPLKNDLLKSALTNTFELTGNIDKAVYVCNKILVKDPSNIEIRKLRAAYLSQISKVDDAIIEYLNILALMPNDMDAKYSVYKLLSSKNISEKDIIKQIYKTDKPNYEVVYSEFSDMLLQKEEFDSAEKYANLLVEEYPNNAKGYILLSEIYMKKGKLKESYEVLTKAKDKADSNDMISKYNVLLAKLSDEPVREANSLISAGLYQQALDVLDSASQENLYVILTQARANYLLKNKQTTLEFLNKAMTLYPENSDVYCAFGYIYLKEKDLESARKYSDLSLKINPKNKTAIDLQDMINNFESQKYIQQIISSYEAQNYTESMRLVDEALKINKKDSLLYYYKALNYIAQNNYAASTASLYKALELDKNNILVYFYLGLAFDNLSEPNNALSYYKKFIDLLPKDDYGESEKLNYAKARINKLKN